MEYTFVRFNDGWWLKVDSIEKYQDYIERTQGKWGDAFLNHVNHDVKGEELTPLAYASQLKAELAETSILGGIMELRAEMISGQLQRIYEDGYILINCYGGYNSCEYEADTFVCRKTLSFPDFTESDIKISRFPGGEHYYARVGDCEIRDGEKMKWNTYDEAYEISKRYLG